MLDQILATDRLQQQDQFAQAVGLAIMAAIIVIGLVVMLVQRQASGQWQSNATTIPPHDPPRRRRTVVRYRVARPRHTS